ncbi:hypothetical protein ABW21_db0208976 [Orbilia brochopaga]|nr:hypothetical protein ABW21_db0208976 [Drechslerella brochopaga]
MPEGFRADRFQIVVLDCEVGSVTGRKTAMATAVGPDGKYLAIVHECWLGVYEIEAEGGVFKNIETKWLGCNDLVSYKLEFGRTRLCVTQR